MNRLYESIEEAVCFHVNCPMLPFEECSWWWMALIRYFEMLLSTDVTKWWSSTIDQTIITSNINETWQFWFLAWISHNFPFHREWSGWNVYVKAISILYSHSSGNKTKWCVLRLALHKIQNTEKYCAPPDDNGWMENIWMSYNKLGYTMLKSTIEKHINMLQFNHILSSFYFCVIKREGRRSGH